MSTEAKATLVLRWIERDQDVPDKVKDKLTSLAHAYNKLEANLGELGFKGNKARRQLDGMDAEFKKQVVSVAKATEQGRLLVGGFEEGEKKGEAFRKRMQHLGSVASKVGIRLGWMGYRMLVIGRFMTNYLMRPINDVISSLKEWDKTMGDVALSIGLLEYYGLASTSTIDTLTNTLYNLPEAGLKIQAAFGLITGIFATIAVDVAPILTKSMVMLGEALLGVWEKSKDKVIPILSKLAEDILPRLVGVIERVGPETLVNFVTALVSVAESFVTILETVEPLLPALGTLLGYLVGISPALMAIGTTLFVISLPLQAFSALCTILGVKLIGVSTSAGVANAALITLKATTLTTIVTLGSLVAALALVATALEVYRIEKTGIPSASTAGMAASPAGVSPGLTGIFSPTQTQLADEYMMGQFIRNRLLADSKIYDAMDVYSKGIPNLGRIPILQHGGIVKRKTLALIGEREEELVAPLSKLPGILGAGNAPVSQEIFVESNVYIGTVTSEADVNVIKEEVSKSIYEALRRKR